MRIIALVLVLLMQTTAEPVEVDAGVLFAQANEQFEERNFETATQLYRQIIASGVDNGIIEYNLGNAYYRLNLIGLARLHYERSLRLIPNDEDALYNIRFIESRFLKQTLREDNFTTVDRVLWNVVSRYPPSVSLPVFIVAFLLLNALVALTLVRRDLLPKALRWTILISLVLVAVISLAFALTTEIISHSRTYGVVIAPDAGVSSEPNREAPSHFPAPEAMKVIITRSQGTWHEITLPNGSKGWISAEAIEII